MKLRRLLALLLALLTVALPFASCGTPDETTEPQNSGDGETTKAWIKDDLDPDLNYGGEKVRILARGDDWYYDEISIEADEVLNIIDESVHEREAYVEERLGIDIVVDKRVIGSKHATLADLTRDYFRAGTDAVDLLASPSNQGFALTTEGVMWDMRTVDNIDLSQPWYAQNFVDLATLNDMTFFITGDALLSLMRYSFATFVNLTLAERYSLPDMYKLVDDGEWTHDFMASTVANVYEDLNGSGKKDDGDLFGFATSDLTGADVYLSSFDLRMLEKNDEGFLVNVVDNEKMQSAVTALCDLFHNNPGANALRFISGGHEYYTMNSAFGSDQYLFADMRLISVESEEFINMESDYGILPTPKWNLDQEEYKTYVYDVYTVLGIVGTVKEEELPMIGAFVEAYSCYSYNATREVYFETALKGRYVRDETSRRMLDQIIEAIYIDPACVYCQHLQLFCWNFRELIKNNNPNWASLYRAQGKIFNTKLEQLNGKFGG